MIGHWPLEAGGHPDRQSTMLELAVLIVIVYALIVFTAIATQRRMMYFPDRESPNPDEFGVSDMVSVEVPTSDGFTLSAWYKPPIERNAPVLVFFHGNAGHIGHRADKVRPFLDRGFGVLLVSYRGYGGNPGAPTEAGLYNDGRAALNWLDEQGVAPDRMILYGESLGTGVAVRMASEAPDDRPVGAVILEAPYTSTVDVAARAYPFLPVRMFMRDRFDSLSIVDRVRAPILVLHGERDTTIPARYGRQMLAAAKEPKHGIFFDAAGHNDLHDHGSAHAVIDFLDKSGFLPAEGR